MELSFLDHGVSNNLPLRFCPPLGCADPVGLVLDVCFVVYVSTMMAPPFTSAPFNMEMARWASAAVLKQA